MLYDLIMNAYEQNKEHCTKSLWISHDGREPCIYAFSEKFDHGKVEAIVVMGSQETFGKTRYVFLGFQRGLQKKHLDKIEQKIGAVYNMSIANGDWYVSTTANDKGKQIQTVQHNSIDTILKKKKEALRESLRNIKK